MDVVAFAEHRAQFRTRSPYLHTSAKYHRRSPRLLVETSNARCLTMGRRDIYYWKCDRPAAFHGTQARGEASANIENQIHDEMLRHFNARQVDLKPGVGQGNHLTWNAEVDGTAMFVRVENGPEKDGHLAIESAVLDQVRDAGVVTPKVFGCERENQMLSNHRKNFSGSMRRGMKVLIVSLPNSCPFFMKAGGVEEN